jgi:hypothetical protein
MRSRAHLQWPAPRRPHLQLTARPRSRWFSPRRAGAYLRTAPLSCFVSRPVTARICSTRGACSETSATVVVVGSSAATENAAGRKRSLVDVLLSVARKLLVP